jgi:hypothetical protein
MVRAWYTFAVPIGSCVALSRSPADTLCSVLFLEASHAAAVSWASRYSHSDNGAESSSCIVNVPGAEPGTVRTGGAIRIYPEVWANKAGAANSRDATTNARTLTRAIAPPPVMWCACGSHIAAPMRSGLVRRRFLLFRRVQTWWTRGSGREDSHQEENDLSQCVVCCLCPPRRAANVKRAGEIAAGRVRSVGRRHPRDTTSAEEGPTPVVCRYPHRRALRATGATGVPSRVRVPRADHPAGTAGVTGPRTRDLFYLGRRAILDSG